MTHFITFLGIAFLCLYILVTKKLEILLSPKLYWMVYFIGLSMGIFIFAMGSFIEHPTSFKEKLKSYMLGILYIYPVILFTTLNPREIQNVNKNVLKEIKPNLVTNIKPIQSLPVDGEGYVSLNLFEL